MSVHLTFFLVFFFIPHTFRNNATWDVGRPAVDAVRVVVEIRTEQS